MATKYKVLATGFNPDTLTGAATTLTLADDAVSAAQALPFTFNFFGIDYTSIYVGSNGAVGFITTDMATGVIARMPDATTPHAQIYGVASDLDPSLGGTIKYETFGTSGTRKFVVEYSLVPNHTTTTALTTFQIKLFEEDFHIEIHTTRADSIGSTVRTQGIENEDSTIGYWLDNSRNRAAFTLTNDAVTFEVDPTQTPSVVFQIPTAFLLGGATWGTNPASSFPVKIAQLVIAQESVTLSQVGVWTYKTTDTATDNLVLSIYDCGGLGLSVTDPTSGTLLATCTRPSNQISTASSAIPYTFVLDAPIQLGEGTTYGFVLTRTSAPVSGGLTIKYNAIGVGPHALQYYSYSQSRKYVSGAWSPATNDYGFILYGLYPVQDQSIISAVQRTQQNLAFPRYIIGGKGTKEGEPTYDVEAMTYSASVLTGAATTLVLGDDDVSAAISLPFTFPFYGDDKSEIYVGANGLVGFNNTDMDAFTPDSIPTAATPNDCIYGFWTDLDPSAGGTVKYQRLGTTPDRIFVIQYSLIPAVGDPAILNSFQIKLFEADNHIEIHTTSATADVAHNEKVTQGVENSDGTSASYLVGRNQATTLALTNDAVSFTPNVASYALFKKSDTGGYGLWRSKVYAIGKDFDVLSITVPLVTDLASGTEIIPALHFDDDTTTAIGTTINSANYSNTDKLIELTAKNFNNQVRGKDNFFLEFQFTGTELAVIGLPISIDVEIMDV